MEQTWSGHYSMFYHFVVVICCSPAFPHSKMGSFVSQLQTVAEIWRVKEGSFSRVFGNLYGKMAQNIGLQKSVISLALVASETPIFSFLTTFH